MINHNSISPSRDQDLIEIPQFEREKENKERKGKMNYCLFFIDDSVMIRKMLKQIFAQEEKYDIYTFACGEDCLKELDKKPDVVVLDFHLSDDGSLMNGLETLSLIREKNPETNIIMLSNQNKIGVAVECLRKGASDYIIKDDVMSVSIKSAVNKIINSLELKAEISKLSETIKRDKLLIKGYFSIMVIMIILILTSMVF